MLWIILTILCGLSPAQENQGRSRFSADKYTRSAQENKVELEGNVTIVKDNSVLKADSVELNTKTETFKAIGNVKYNSGTLDIRSLELDGSMNSAKGMIINGKILSGKDIFEGAKINRVSRSHFLIDEGSYTSCTNSPPDWRLYGNHIDMTTGEYAHLKDVVVEAFGLPITYIPYLVLPIKNERQTGFLPPSFGFGTDGFNIQEPYFWAISRSYDATFTLGHYGNRGTKESVEFRSVFSDESSSKLYYFHIDDTKFASIIYNGLPLGKKNRTGFKMDEDFKLLDDTYLKMKVAYASDTNIPRDFADEMEGRADPALESRFVFMTHTDNFAYTADASYYRDLLSKNPLESNKQQLQRLPELTINFAKTKYSIFMFDADASYLNVYRPGPFFDDVNGNNIFDGTEFIRTGQRFDFFPRVSIPITTTALKITPVAGMRYDFYKLPVDGNAHRTYTDFDINMTSEISRVYQRGDDKQYRAVKHTIEPFVDYHVIPTIQQTAHPFFDNTRNNITAPMFDSVDQIGKTNLITYGITNRLLLKAMKNFISRDDMPATTETPKETDDECKSCAEQKAIQKDITESSTEKFLDLRESGVKPKKKPKTKKMEDDEFTVVQPLQWRIYQSYDFLNPTKQPFGYLYSEITAGHAWMSLLLTNFYNVYTKKMGVSSQLRLTGGKKYIQMGYYYDKTNPNANTDQLQLQFGFGVWRFATNVRFILNNSLPGKFTDKIQDKYFDVIYSPPSSCWFLKFAVSAPYDKPGFNVFISFNLLISGQAIGFGADSNLLSAMNFGSK
ncbi:MAG: LPS assembly protein LptD [Proteobacteria bacterium]|nr:LPS assembly protein LptD [Pseudomonadota bacterium]